MIPQLPSSLLLLAFSAHHTLGATDCFDRTGGSRTKPADSTQRISAGIDCTTTHNDCRLDAGGWLTLNATLNITTTHADKVFDAIHSSFDENFNETLIGWVTNSTMKINQGQKGYVGFTADMLCYDGVVGDCIGDDVVEKGTVVEACTPLRSSQRAGEDGLPGLEGEITFVQTDDIGGMESNPAMVRPKEGNAAGRLGFGSGTLGLVVFGAICWHFL